MHVGIVRRGFSPTGGAESYLLRLASGLQAAGHKITLIASQHWPARAWPFGKIHTLQGNTPTSFANSVRKIRSLFDVTLALDRVPGCDVFRAGDGVHAAWLKRRSAFEPRWKSFLSKWNPKHATLIMLERMVIKSTPKIIANSRMVAREISEFHEIAEDSIHVIPNGISSSLTTIPKSEARIALSIPTHSFCCLFLGTGWKRKGLETAIRAITPLAHNTILLVAGHGPIPRRSPPQIRFLGPVLNLSALLSAADILVLPTIYDPFSNACLEALGAGLPVLTTSANGFSEIITPGIHGDIIEPGDHTRLTQLIRTWQQKDLTLASEKCRQLACQYPIEKNVSSTIQILESALADHKN